MNCPHGRGICAGCTELLVDVVTADCEVLIELVLRLSRCQHGQVDEQYSLTRCMQCGRVRHRLADGWTTPTLVDVAKKLDDDAALAGVRLDLDEEHSDAKNVIPIKTRT